MAYIENLLFFLKILSTDKECVMGRGRKKGIYIFFILF